MNPDPRAEKTSDDDVDMTIDPWAGPDDEPDPDLAPVDMSDEPDFS